MLSDKLKQLRKAQGLRQAELAKKLDVSQGAVAHWESGRNEPSIDDLRKLAKELKTDLSFLAGSPSSGLVKVDYIMIEGSAVSSPDTDFFAPKIQLSEDIEDYIITLVGSDNYKPTYREGDLIYSRQRGVTPKVAATETLEVLVQDECGNKYIGKLNSTEDRTLWSIHVPNSAPVTIKVKSVHPVIWVKRNI
jgi:transcriptional regulator with XRE-family HTH domain